jgi:hypothetical protein
MKFAQSKDVAWNYLEDNIIAFNLGGDREFHHLNATAAAVFNALGTPRSREDLVGALTSEFDVSPEQASQDLGPLLEDLKAKHLIVEA